MCHKERHNPGSSAWGAESRPYPSQQAQRGERGGHSRGQGSSGPPFGAGRRRPQSNSNPSTGLDWGRTGSLLCDHSLEDGLGCVWRSNSDVALRLHRADRHLIMPPGGATELERIDPILEAERKDKTRRARRAGPDDEAEERANALIPGLNIRLDTPELIAKWVAERKKRWPTAAVIKQKALHSWDSPSYGRGKPPKDEQGDKFVENDQDPASDDDVDDDDKNDNGDFADDLREKHDDPAKDAVRVDAAEETSSSDVDEVNDAVSSKIAPTEKRGYCTSDRPFCRFFRRGACRNGDTCMHRHEIEAVPNRQSDDKKRKRPRAPSPNPFEAPHLLRALLRNEIAQHVNYVAQVVRFLVRNDYLDGFERRIGDAAEQARRRNLVVDVTTSDKDEVNTRVAVDAPLAAQQQPIVDGGLPVLGSTLYEPRSPTLRPLSNLLLPPEPDEFALMDPLRAQDAKPLSHDQCREVAQDEGVRATLTDGAATSDQRRPLSKGMVRALSTLDDLPSYAHRASALELILGVSEQSAQHAHQLGATYVRSDRQASAPSARVIGESELFRLGLRVGPLEVQRIRRLAARMSGLIGGPSFDAADEDDPTALQPWHDEKTRREMQIRQWHREADWRDEMRKLGVEVD